jgi:hypothetical protein
MAIMGYKIFEENWTCRGFQYEVGKTAVHEGAVVLCLSGLHFCIEPLQCLDYYNISKHNKYARVMASGVIEKASDKCAAEILTVVEEISFTDFKKLCTGTCAAYYSDGSLQSIRTYRDGKLNGKSISYYLGGEKIKMSAYYQNNKLHGTYKEYRQDGLICRTADFDNGVLVSETFQEFPLG